MAQSLLQVQGLSQSFGKFQAVNPIDFHLNVWEIIILTGPNGGGKTALLQTIANYAGI